MSEEGSQPQDHHPSPHQPTGTPGHTFEDGAVSHSANGFHYQKHDHGYYHMPSHVYNRYTADGMESGPHQNNKPDIESGQVTLYIPKVKKEDGSKTLIRRRRASSKKRSSSKRKPGRETLSELLHDEDNHLLPSLRLQRRSRTKTLKDRRNELEEEKKHEDQIDAGHAKSFKDRYQDVKDREESTAGNFADLLRESTLTRMKKLGEWKPPRKWKVYKRRSRDFFQNFAVWMPSFKEIEGKFGTAYMSFFRFIRWLMFLNIYIMVIMFCVTTVPFLALPPESFRETVDINQSVFHEQAVNCSLNYLQYNEKIKTLKSTFEQVLDFLQGTGWMERTILFVGSYYNKTYTGPDEKTETYNMSLAYLLATLSCFIISLILIIGKSARTVKATFGVQSTVAVYTNHVFGGWDYAITNAKAAFVKKANLRREFMDCLAEDLRKIKRKNRSANDKATLYLTRIMVNCVVIVVLGGCLFLVYFTSDKLLELQKEELNEIVALIVQYLPYLTITILNFLIPLVFSRLVILEDYPHNVALILTLARSICFRLASLAVLMFSLYRLLISDANPDAGQCGNRRWSDTSFTARGSIKCWESYFGQQIYKLVLLDLIVETAIIVFIQFPRRLLYNRYGSTVALFKKLGPQEFDLPQNVIDIIYSQTLCWIGMFFSPLIPFMTFLKCIIFFYLRKWTLLRNCVQGDEQYRTSRSHSLFMYILLISFVFACVPVGYMISSVPPSQSCGPYRVYSNENYTMFETLSITVTTWPVVIKDIVMFLGTVGFLIPVIIILILLMYFFGLLSQGYKKKEELLRKQLRLVSIGTILYSNH